MTNTSTNTATRTVIIALITFSVGAFSSAIYAATASVDEISGYVTATNEIGEVMRLKNGDTVINGSVINTGANSSVTIILPNGEEIILSSLSSYTVKLDTNTGGFAQRSLQGRGPTQIDGTTAGGAISESTTPEAGGSPTN